MSAELHAVVSSRSGEILWAGLATAEDAQQKALAAAVNRGGAKLLSGEDLGAFLLAGREPGEPNFPLGPRWPVGQRVELVERRNGGYGPEKLRPGTVERIDRRLVWHENLVVAFDDGETRPINPDVMRHAR